MKNIFEILQKSIRFRVLDDIIGCKRGDIMSKSKIIERLKQMKWISKHWRVKDFFVYEDDEIIKFSYYHGDMGKVDMIIYHKKDSYIEVFELNNYYGTTDKVVGLYI